jgi:hypothetical protein
MKKNKSKANKLKAPTTVGSGDWLGVMDSLNKSVKIWRKYFVWPFEVRIINFFGKTIASFVVTFQLFGVNPAVANPYSVQIFRDVRANQTQFRNSVVNLTQSGLVKFINGLSLSSQNCISPELVHQQEKFPFLALFIQDRLPSNGEQVDNKPSSNSNNDRKCRNDQSDDWKAGFRMLKWWHWVICFVVGAAIGLVGPISWYVVSGYALRARMTPNVES